MYARFIPPLPGQTPPQRREATPPPQPRASIAEVSGTGFGYSRYIPGATSQIQRDAPTIVRFDDEPSSPKPKRKRDEGEPEDKLKGQKRSKKDKKVVKQRQNSLERLDQGANRKINGAQTRDLADGVEGNKETVEHRETDATPREDVEMSDRLESTINNAAAEAPEPKAQKEKKKEKKKKIKEREHQANEQEAVEEAVEEGERHKAVFERKVRSLKFAETAKNRAVEGEKDDDEQPVESHDLEPLPQPEPAPVSTEKPSYDILPPWLSAPIRVSQDTRASFTHLGILPKAARILGEKGYAEAFAVQTAALPLLLPNGAEQPGDLLISAATGSGKTLAYALPVARDLSNGVVTRLRALVVLPTRELVKQAQEVFEICARAYEGEDRKRVRIGIAIGSQSLSSEQESLMTSETRYDPDMYKKLEEQEEEQRLRGAATAAASIELDGSLPPSFSNDAFSAEVKTSRLGPWEGQVVDFYSKVDVLICTPGRLVEHMEQTPGFTLDFVRWLIVDEADKLLAQSFQGWLDVVLEAFKAVKFSARDFPDMAYTGVRKVVLSATLTRDLSLLTQLALRRPRLIVLEGEGNGEGDAQGVSGAAEHSLPQSLKEFAVRVHDANLKPLYLLDLLGGQEMATQDIKTPGSMGARKADLDDDDDDARDGTSSENTSSDDTSSEDSSSDDTSSEEVGKKQVARQPRTSGIPMSLIFTKSNESALRLSRLLTLLDASLTGHMSTLTSNTPTSIRRKTLAAFAAPESALRLIIASDLVARGIDIPRLAHVINYDLPPSVAGYVHRVGRTARAGRSGCAWTLVGDAESGWFWGKIAKGAGVKRAHKVERVRVEEMSEQRIQEYEEALDKLGKEVMEPRRR